MLPSGKTIFTLLAPLSEQRPSLHELPGGSSENFWKHWALATSPPDLAPGKKSCSPVGREPVTLEQLEGLRRK